MRFSLVCLGLFGCSMAMAPIETDSPVDTDVNVDSDVPGEIVLNELLASNDASTLDEYGENDDWFELYNPGSEAVDLEGWTIADSENVFEVPGPLSVPAGGFLVIWCDGSPDQGVAHVDFKLSGDGDRVLITDPEGTVIVDETFGAQETDVSYGRSEDGGDDWTTFTTPTPGASNG